MSKFNEVGTRFRKLYKEALQKYFKKQDFLFRELFLLTRLSEGELAHATLQDEVSYNFHIHIVLQKLEQFLLKRFGEKWHYFSDSIVVLGIESRGFIVGKDIARSLGLQFFMARESKKKKGSIQYGPRGSPYGMVNLYLPLFANLRGKWVIIVDDDCLSGNTILRAAHLVKKNGGFLLCAVVLLEWPAHRGQGWLWFTKNNIEIISACRCFRISKNQSSKILL